MAVSHKHGNITPYEKYHKNVKILNITNIACGINETRIRFYIK